MGFPADGKLTDSLYILGMKQEFLCRLGFIILAGICVISGKTYAQAENHKWGKATVSYASPVTESRRPPDLSIHKVSDIIAKPLFAAYRVFISDVDGSHCPFSPTCSGFMLESIQKANFLAGVLLGVDRLTRDAMLINRDKHYHLDNTRNRFIDPVDKYIQD